MDYRESVTFLYSLQYLGWKLGLERLSVVLEKLGNPHEKMRSLHIAGTNGKGSVTAMCESILRTAGYRTAMFTSPHLVEPTERIQVNGEKITPTEFARIVTELKPLLIESGCTFFEAITIIAFLCFANSDIDIALFEVGLGGRLDATNIITPVLSIITDISFDHTAQLGNTLEDITIEKAGIIKKRVPCIIGSVPQRVERIIEGVCEKQQSLFLRSKDYCNAQNICLDRSSHFDLVLDQSSYPVELSLVGSHQVSNSCTAAAACKKLNKSGMKISDKHIVQGLEKTVWPGRFEIISQKPHIIADVAHNVASIMALSVTLKELYSDRDIILMIGVLKDKDFKEIVKIIAPIAKEIIAVQPQTPRAMTAKELAQNFRNMGFESQCFISIEEGLKYVMDKDTEKSIICITGSHYVVGEAMQIIKKD